MKKILMSLCCMFMLGVAHAGCNSPVTLAYQGNQRPWNEEFLYESKSEYDKAKTGYDNTKNSSGDGRGYECDATFSGSCSTADMVTLPAGHVFKGNVVNHKETYECKTGFSWGWRWDDRWVPVESGVCDTPQYGKIAVGRCVEDGNHECRVLTETECSGYDKSDKNGVQFWGVCREGPRFLCVAIKCDHDMEPDAAGICKPKSNGGGQTGCKNQEERNACLEKGSQITSWNDKTCECTCKDDTKKWNGKACVAKDDNHDCGSEAEWKNGRCQCNDSKKEWKNGRCVEKANCRDSRTTNVGKACCDIPSAVYSAKEDTCTCQNGEKFELYNTNHGHCVKDAIQPVVYNCSLSMFADWRSLYKDCPDVIAALGELESYCASSERNEEGYKTRYDNLMRLRQMCEESIRRREEEEARRRAQLEGATANIDKAGKKIGDILGGLNVSVWKNAEGNFNTARLASDSIAGVVLGTAGGLITSSIVKKSQVKAGFEDIQCTVGGQKVADWGDEFTVGIR